MRPATNDKLQLIAHRMNLLNRRFHPTNILFRKLHAVKRIVVHNKSSSLFSSDQKVNDHVERLVPESMIRTPLFAYWLESVWPRTLRQDQFVVTAHYTLAHSPVAKESTN